MPTFTPLEKLLAESRSSPLRMEFLSMLQLAQQARAALVDALQSRHRAAWVWHLSPSLAELPWFKENQRWNTTASLAPDQHVGLACAAIASENHEVDKLLDNKRGVLQLPGIVMVNQEELNLAQAMNHFRGRLKAAYTALGDQRGFFTDNQSGQADESTLRGQAKASARATRWHPMQGTRQLVTWPRTPDQLGFFWSQDDLVYRVDAQHILVLLHQLRRSEGQDTDVEDDIAHMLVLQRSRPNAVYARRRPVNAKMRVSIGEASTSVGGRKTKWTLRHAALPMMILGTALPEVTTWPRLQRPADPSMIQLGVEYQAKKTPRKFQSFTVNNVIRRPVSPQPLLKTVPIYEYIDAL
jgi:hypothetical protein